MDLRAAPQEAVTSISQEEQGRFDTNGASVAEAFPAPFVAAAEASAATPVAAAAAAAVDMSEAAAAQPPDAGPVIESQSYMGLGELADVEELRGVRVSVDGNSKAIVEYLVHWKVSLGHADKLCARYFHG